MRDIDAFQALTRRTQPKATVAEKLGHFALGLCEEAGEAATPVKRCIYYGQHLDEEMLTKELGDVLWYACALADAAGISRSKVLQANTDKLAKRYPGLGWTAEDAQARADDHA